MTGQGSSERSTLPYAGDHVRALAAALDRFHRLDGGVQTAVRWGHELAERLPAGARLLAAGNGGSAAQAQHLTAELVGRYRDDRRPFSAITLHTEMPTVTAIGNDYGPDAVFARQVWAHARPDDLVVLLSTSGRSSNLVVAARAAAELGATVWAMTGPAPNPLAAAADDALCVEAAATATIQELHLVAVHLLCAALDVALGISAPTSSGQASSDGVAAPTAQTDDVRRSGGRHTEWSPRRPGRMTSGEVGGQPAASPEPADPSEPTAAAEPTESTQTGNSPIVVVGDVLLDRDLVGEAGRLCPDAPVPVVERIVERERPGGAGLAALLVARDGRRPVVLIAALGEDAAARRLRALLEPHVQLVTLRTDGSTAVKTRVRAGDHLIVRLDHGERPAPIGALPADARTAIAEAAAVLVSDYGRGVSAHPQVRTALAATRAPIVWDPHPNGSAPVPGVAVVTPNLAESAAMASAARTAGPADDPSASAGTDDHASTSASGRILAAADRASRLVAQWQAAAVAVTLGADGAVLSFGAGSPLVTPAPNVRAGDPCGAGDRFAATVVARLADGALTSEAVAAAVVDASAFVAAGGAAAVPAQPGANPPGAAADGMALAASVRRSGGTVVATGGCFDLLHAGHVAMLRAARRLGDCLVVCLNSDASIRRAKGVQRPLVPEHDRRQVLEALECVDAVVVFDEDTPARVLTDLRPHVWAKGGDYAALPLPEAQVLAGWGGRVLLLPYLDGRSTTRLVRAAAARSAPARSE